MKSREEMLDLLEDLCTINEIKAMAQRYEVAKMLYDNKNYVQIAQETGASTATISRVNRCLNYGSGGYRRALSRLGGGK
ncbi:MAG: hypothetical protein GX196_04170 [Clostridiaceae bacterium]|nr:hypothetical protein [Clostridiaceae bacterium]